jgi:tetratricopeptide (TPR) repeat protein
MHIDIIIGSVLFLTGAVPFLVGEPLQSPLRVERTIPRVRRILREASEIALRQGEQGGHWTENALLTIGKVQIRAGDFDGALQSIRGSAEGYRRDEELLHLAQALARHGNRQQGLAVLWLLSPGDNWQQVFARDAVQLKWAEYLIACGDLGGAAKAVEEVESQGNRSAGLRYLGAAYSKSGDAIHAAEYFTRAIDAAILCRTEYDRARSLWGTAESQLRVGAADEAKATLRRMVETIEYKDPSAKVSALLESARVYAKAGDKEMARRLFAQAKEARRAVNDLNRYYVLEQIALAQVDVGFIDDAMQVASSERVLTAIVVAQLKAGEVKRAIRTALSIEFYPESRDEALDKVVDHFITTRNLKSALATTATMSNPSNRAAAMLKVATAQAMFGDRKAAAATAARIQLVSRFDLPPILKQRKFDYRKPHTWGFGYDFGGVFSMGIHMRTNQLASEVAAAAMTLSQALKQKPAQSYAVSFQHTGKDVTRALARAHAASGHSHDALTWAKQIGRAERVPSSGDWKAISAVEQRLYALIGVAEGILDQPDKVKEQ